MPANSKYLNPSVWQRFAKISAAVLGAYAVSMSMHLAVASWTNHVIVIISMTFSGFIFWVVLMVLPFLAKNGWNAWLLYLALILLFSAITFFGKLYNPHFLLT